MTRIISLLAAVGLVLALTGCGGGTSTAQPTVTVTKEPPAAEPDGPTSTPSPTKAAKKRVPDVVGMNHQAAQDKLQAAGFFGLAEQDATGQGRALLWDRNWTVVRQKPKAGKRVSTDATITLFSKKTEE